MEQRAEINELLAESARGATVLVRKSSNQLVYIYTGFAQALMVPPSTFLVAIQAFERNCAMFRDTQRAFYQNGISDHLDSVNKFVEWQRALRRRMSWTQKLFCLGTSAGGYAALLFGHMLVADEVWAFGPPTDVQKAEAIHNSSLSGDTTDLANILNHHNGRTRYNVYYNENHDRDRNAAFRIARCAGVNLWPQRGNGHDVVRVLLDEDKLRTLMPAPSCPGNKSDGR